MAGKKTEKVDHVGLNTGLQQYVTRKQMAALMDMSDRKLTDLISMGLAVQGPTNRQFDALKTIHNYIGHLRKQAAGRATSNGMNLSDVRAEREVVEKHISEIKLAQLRGEVLPLPEVSEAWNAFATSVRTKFMSLPTKVRSGMPHLTAHDGEAMKKIIRGELEDLADEVEATVVGADPKVLKRGK